VAETALLFPICYEKTEPRMKEHSGVLFIVSGSPEEDMKSCCEKFIAGMAPGAQRGLDPTVLYMVSECLKGP
jgi:hypothetical protein